MPRYDFKCSDGHVHEKKLDFTGFNQLREDGGGNAILPCAECGEPATVIISAVPKVFAVNDRDTAFSQRMFGMGGLSEV